MAEQPTVLRTRNLDDERRLERFEHRMGFPIFISAILPLILTMAGADSIVASVVLVVTWFVFIADLVVHARLIPGYLRSHRGWFDLGVVVLTAPWFLLPGMGNSRFAALARLARLARIMKAGGGRLIRLGQSLGRIGLVLAGILLTCAYVGYSAERSVNDMFGSFGDAVWWATVTITTVGYGDIYPVTTTGRVTGAVLMFSGLALLGVLAGILASFFGLSGGAAAAEAALEPAAEPSIDVAGLRAKVAELDRALAALQRDAG